MPIYDAQHYFHASEGLAKKCNHPAGINGTLMSILINTPSGIAVNALICLLFKEKLDKIMAEKNWDGLNSIVKELEMIIEPFITDGSR